ncbi:MAG: helix-turn-helix domain-containing protein [Chitinophagales bacterium]|nr:helix-turn-helix domain-containing protein [Chitinophagales bacterium]
MEALESIRALYTPIQPTVKIGQGDILYQEIQPSSQLQPFIYCYWQLKTKTTLENPYTYKAVSDGCVDIFFNLNNLSENFVMGFSKKYTAFSIGNEFNYAGIRFFPSAFTQLFGISAKTLSNQDQPLASVLPDLADFISKEIDLDFSTSIRKLDRQLIDTLRQSKHHLDHRFYDALLLIFKHHGYLETENELNTGLSPRQLRRIFNYYIGTTPKTFSQVVRFQYILNAKPSMQSLRDNRIFYDVGFYDQAHFIKDFKKFYGVTPSQAFQ